MLNTGLDDEVWLVTLLCGSKQAPRGGGEHGLQLNVVGPHAAHRRGCQHTRRGRAPHHQTPYAGRVRHRSDREHTAMPSQWRLHWCRVHHSGGRPARQGSGATKHSARHDDGSDSSFAALQDPHNLPGEETVAASCGFGPRGGGNTGGEDFRRSRTRQAGHGAHAHTSHRSRPYQNPAEWLRQAPLLLPTDEHPNRAPILVIESEQRLGSGGSQSLTAWAPVLTASATVPWTQARHCLAATCCKRWASRVAMAEDRRTASAGDVDRSLPADPITSAVNRKGANTASAVNSIKAKPRRTRLQTTTPVNCCKQDRGIDAQQLLYTT